MTTLKVKTLNSVYELKGNTLYRNGEVYTDHSLSQDTYVKT